ncbi:MAG: hypothetical protein AAGA54_08595 [Myxococcota bacterium]
MSLALVPVDPQLETSHPYRDHHAATPVAIDGLNLDRLEVDDYTRCVYSNGSDVRCWRRYSGGVDQHFPSPRGLADVVDVGAGDQLCAVETNRTVLCRGLLACFRDHLEESKGRSPADPVEIPGLDKGIRVDTSISMGCVVREDQSVGCWGQTVGQGPCDPKVKDVPGLEGVVDVSVMSGTACALTNNNRVWCWGSNRFGALGRPKPYHSWAPFEIELAYPSVKVVTSFGGAASLRVDGSVVAWGDMRADEDTSPTVFDFSGPALDVVALEGMVCALLADRSVECRGVDIDMALARGRPRPPFEGKEAWLDPPVYRLAPRPSD